MRLLPTIGRVALLFGALSLANAAAVTLPTATNLGDPAPYAAPLPPKPPDGPPFDAFAAGLALVLPVTAGGYLALALVRARRMSCPPCPACGSRRGAVVGQVGQYHRCCRCHDCGYLWEHDGAVTSHTVAAAARAHHRPGGLR